MKILLISPLIYPSSIGGLEIYNYYFLKEVKRLGYNISLLSYHKGFKELNIPQYRLFTRNAFFQSIHIFFHLVFHKYDIVHIPYASNSFIANPVTIFKIFFKKNDYVIYIHGGGMLKWKNPFIHSLFFKKAKEIFSVSEPVKKEYEQRTSKKVTTILPLIPFEESKKERDEIRKNLGVIENEKVMLYVGSIKKIKGSDFLVNSLIKFGREYFQKNNLKMIFIGNGELKEKLEKLVFDNNMKDEIKFLGERNKEEIPNYIKASDIFIFPSEMEGTPLSLLEALHNKLLVIATDVTGINNIIKNKINGLLFSFNDYNSLKCAIEFALANKEDCIRITDYAKNITLKDFDYKKNILEQLKLYAN